MTKVPVNFRIDSELLALARARSEQEGITLIALLERSLKSTLEVSASAAPSDRISVEAVVDTVVNTVKTDIERVKVNLTDVEAIVKTIAESVNTIKSEVTGLSDRLNLVSATVDTIVNTDTVNTVVDTIVNTDTVNTVVKPNVNTDTVNTVVKPNVNTDKAIDGSITSTAGSSQEWIDLATVAAKLEVLPKSVSGACSKRGRDIGNDTIEFEVAGKTIHKKGNGLKAAYMLIP
jgi:prophage DNA circulation protein